ncbi:hypothetical protein GQ457_06G037720 [Hibiscus cannabinus]
MLRLMPKMLALMAVQRQTAASRSTRPWRREQHGCTGGEPTVALTKLSTLAHTPNLRASLGHLPRADGVGVGVGFGFGLGFGLGLGLGFGLVGGQGVEALPREKKRMLSKKKRAMGADVFEAIFDILETLVACLA